MPEKLVLLADLGALKAYKIIRDELHGSPRIDLIESVENVAAHQRISDTLTDQAGRFPVGNGIAAGQMSHGENHNLQTETEKRLIEQLSSRVNEIVGAADGAHFHFAAPSQINQRVVDGFKPHIRARMQKNLASNLIKMDKAELLARFEA